MSSPPEVFQTQIQNDRLFFVFKSFRLRVDGKHICRCVFRVTCHRALALACQRTLASVKQFTVNFGSTLGFISYLNFIPSILRDCEQDMEENKRIQAGRMKTKLHVRISFENLVKWKSFRSEMAVCNQKSYRKLFC